MASDYLLSVFSVPNHAAQVRVTCLPLKEALTASVPAFIVEKTVLLERSASFAIGKKLATTLSSLEESGCIQMPVSANEARILGLLVQVN